MDKARSDAQATALLNRQFHETIYAAAHNRYLVQMLEKLANSLALLRGTTFKIPGRANQAAREHRDIIDCIVRRDADAAEAAARAHTSAAHRARIELMMSQESGRRETLT
jgi:DNA-binding GntR family transcriptional regulator